MCAENSWDQDYCNLGAKNEMDKVAHLKYIYPHFMKKQAVSAFAKSK